MHSELDTQYDAMPVVRNRADFDPKSGNLLERLIFNNRLPIVLACIVVTAVLGWQATRLPINASFEKLIPASHPYIRHYLERQDDLRGLGNSIRIVVENTQGSIYDREYLDALREVNDAVNFIPGVSRAYMKSLWTPLVRWTEVTEEGFQGGPVMPATFNGSPEAIEELRVNVVRAGLAGTLVAADGKSSAILVPLLSVNPETNQPLDYGRFSQELEKIRAKVEGDGSKIRVRIVGFAKLAGDLIDGLVQVMAYFLVAALIAGLIIFWYTRCIRSTLLVVLCSIVAVLWQLGLVKLLGFALDPYSVLVPFLIFAIGVSHGAQKMNGIMQDVGRGTHKYVAARYTFRRLFMAGLTALLADVVGFAVLMVIDIPVIKDLALTASIGVGLLVFTNLVLLPILLSYTGVSPNAAQRSLAAENNEASGVWSWLGHLTERRYAAPVLIVSAIAFAIGFWFSHQVQIGDLDAGAPELRPDSRYNQDDAFVTANYGQSSDQFAVIVTTEENGCQEYPTLAMADRLGWELQQVEGVQSTLSLASNVRRITQGNFENSPKWFTISRNQSLDYSAVARGMDSNPDLVNSACSVFPVIAYLTDHRAATLSRVLEKAEEFAEKYNDDTVQFRPTAGSAGIAAVTNVVVKEANRTMLLMVYAAVAVLCFIAFRSWRAVLVALIPLMLTSVLCEALMVWLGIGIKVATLPVIALGVGIGVDYALYLLSVQLGLQRSGMSLPDAYRRAVAFTGKVVALVGITLGAGVVTWAWSPIKFQADMGILLTFMFIWNMLGALILIPALSHLLLRNVGTKANTPPLVG